MASKSDAGSESPTAFDESWIMIDEMPENDDELDESVLNPVSARARTVSNLVQRMRRKRSQTNSGDDQAVQRSRSETEGRLQASDNRSGVIRSRSSTFTDRGEKQQRAQGERLATTVLIQ